MHAPLRIVRSMLFFAAIVVALLVASDILDLQSSRASRI